jgi:hypothetical protein
MTYLQYEQMWKAICNDCDNDGALIAGAIWWW